MGPDLTFAAFIIFVSTIGISLYTLYKNQSLYWKMILSPYQVYHYKKYYQLITSGFIHGDISHLLFNMITFFFFAFSLEKSIGTISFSIIYFGSMVLADISTVIKNKNNPNYYSLGASGAVSGILFASILHNPASKMLVFPIPFPIPSPIFAILYLLYSHFAAKRSGDNINHDAHLWGALSGTIIAIIMEPNVVAYFISSIF